MSGLKTHLVYEQELPIWRLRATHLFTILLTNNRSCDWFYFENASSIVKFFKFCKVRLEIFKCTWVKCLLETNLASIVRPLKYWLLSAHLIVVSLESRTKFAFSLVLHYYAKRLAEKTRATLPFNQKWNRKWIPIVTRSRTLSRAWIGASHIHLVAVLTICVLCDCSQ